MTLRRSLCLAAVALLLAGCGTLRDLARPSEDERIADVVARAVSYPQQDSTDGLTAAIRATSAGERGIIDVIETEDLEPQSPDRLLMRVRVLISMPGSQGGGLNPDTPPYDVCYDMLFNEHGSVGNDEVDCPPHPRPVPPVVPEPYAVIVDGSDEAVVALLERLPDGLTGAEVSRRVEAALPPLEEDPRYGPQARPPRVQALVEADGDVGVSVFAAASRDCLLASRESGRVVAGRLGFEESQPGELSCDPETALARH